MLHHQWIIQLFFVLIIIFAFTLPAIFVLGLQNMPITIAIYIILGISYLAMYIYDKIQESKTFRSADGT
jgi:hypothetical protein